MSKPMSEQMQQIVARYEKATGKKFDQKTKADHIRSMTDEELAYFLHGIYCDGHANEISHIYDVMLPYYCDMLKQPYKEEA